MGGKAEAIESTDARIKRDLGKRRAASRMEGDGWFARNGVGDYICPE